MPRNMLNKNTKFEGAINRFVPIKADASGNLPTEIMLVKTGAWGNSVKGELTITTQDLREMKENFDNGIGRFGGGTVGLPIDFGHAEWERAAAWINKLELRNNDSELWSTETEWTRSGAEAVQGGDYKGISPSFYPSDRGGYIDPEDYDSAAKPNTLVGAALTNIPFFKGLTPLKADNLASDENDDNILFISDNKSEKDHKVMPKTLDEVRVIDASALTDEDRKILDENQDKLSADERVKFGFQTANEPDNNAEQFSAEDRQVLADIRDGKKVVVDKTEHDDLKAQVEAATGDVKAMRRREIEKEIADKHVSRGAIKADQVSKWADLVEADESNKQLLESLADNPVLASEVGSSNAENQKTAVEQFGELVKATQAENENMPYRDVVAKVRRENAELAKQYDEESQGN